MSTPFCAVHEAFFSKIERDGSFFNYFNLTDQDSLRIAKSRADKYLLQSITRILLSCDGEGAENFLDVNITADDYNKEFTNDLSVVEIELLSNLMLEAYLQQDIARLKSFEVNFTPTDLQVFSPSNSRRTYMEMYDAVCKQNITLLDKYASRDRSTYSLKTIDYAALTSYSDADEDSD